MRPNQPETRAGTETRNQDRVGGTTKEERGTEETGNWGDSQEGKDPEERADGETGRKDKARQDGDEVPGSQNQASQNKERDPPRRPVIGQGHTGNE